MGIARLALAVLGALGLLALIVLGAISLTGGFGAEPEAGSATPPATKPLSAPSDSPSRAPTVFVECVQERCPTVFLKVTGGDVLFDREMTRGEQAQSFDDKVDVVLTDASAVRVRVNGAEHPPGKVGERQEFTVPRE
ncbi:hypothetical protein Plo01_14510 [Planobispora longispora]|uniref:DUF4115 domain-containing protein n=2 Tax=Planobispora longispora TaxID=28887 RepID=A0A8J3RFZ8_9ACTN|nr:hypothetical protein Plo01_14510 [Planobispora longispora]